MLLTTRRCATSAAVVLLGLFAGCSTYEARPLDPGAFHRSYIERSPSDESVAAFARRLAQTDDTHADFDPSDGLTLPEAEAVALFFNPDLRVARSRAAVADAAARNAGMWEDPVFGFDGARILSGVSDPWIAGATLDITFPISGRLEAEKSLAGSQHAAALERIRAEEWSARNRLRRRWLEWSALRLQIDESRRHLASLDDILTVTDRLQQAGEMSRPSARLFRLEHTLRQNDLRTAEAEARAAEISIRALMGLAPDAPLSLIPGIITPPPDAIDRTTIPFTNPSLGVLRAEYESAERTLALEVRKQYPDITIGPGIGTEDADTRVLLGVSLPIPLWNRNQRGAAEAEAAREAARTDFETMYEKIIADLGVAQTRLDSATARRAELETTLVPMVDEQVADVEQIGRAGAFDALLAMDSISRQHEARVRVIDARLEEATAAVNVHELLGPAPRAASAPTEPSPADPPPAATRRGVKEITP